MSGRSRTVLKTLGVLAALALAAAVAIVGIGIYNVSARAGHLPGVAWVLHTTFRNSVELRAPPPSQVPNLNDADLIALGARHFEASCRVCHSAPGAIRTATMRAMLPSPPHIVDAVADWRPGELYWIVREGVKMSGMPGWPAARDEEVWPVVAFLAHVREMGAEGYAELTALPRDEPEGLAYCAGCHGTDGRAPNDYIPRLDIQSEAYLLFSLEAYREGGRQSGIMQHAATEVPAEAIPELARYFAEQPAGGPAPAVDPDLAAEGRRLAWAETGSGDVPACRACHGPWPRPIDNAFPSLAGQDFGYLERQLELWREGRRGGGPRVELMHEAAADLEDADIEALAAYYAGLAPAKLNEIRPR